MARDPLRVLQAVRRLAVEQARRALGACLKAETEAREVIRSIDDGVRRDREASDLWLDAHRFQDMFAMRLACIKRERQAALAALAAAEACSEEARGAVAAARMAAEAVDRLIDERAASIEADAASKAQHALDDIARARQAASRRGKRDNGW